MATRYQIVARPTSGVQSAIVVIAADGTGARETVVGNAVAIPTGTYVSVLQSLVNKVVQPSAAQAAGLIAYMAAIEAGTNTAAAETAIAGL